jgi:hypothetical protein
MSGRGRLSAQGAGVAWMLASCLSLTIGDAISKLLTTTYAVGQIIVARSVAILLIAIIPSCSRPPSS